MATSVHMYGFHPRLPTPEERRQMEQGAPKDSENRSAYMKRQMNEFSDRMLAAFLQKHGAAPGDEHGNAIRTYQLRDLLAIVSETELPNTAPSTRTGHLTQISDGTIGTIITLLDQFSEIQRIIATLNDSFWHERAETVLRNTRSTLERLLNFDDANTPKNHMKFTEILQTISRDIDYIQNNILACARRANPVHPAEFRKKNDAASTSPDTREIPQNDVA